MWLALCSSVSVPSHLSLSGPATQPAPSSLSQPCGLRQAASPLWSHSPGALPSLLGPGCQRTAGAAGSAS